MGFDTDVNSCAAKVQSGDPLRFRAAMAAPVATRPVLFVIYAFNLEVARAPWVTKEPLIAQMRLQFWHDVLEQIEAGEPVRPHEVATPLARVLTPRAAELLKPMIKAREQDLERAPFEDAGAVQRYLADTAGTLAVATAHACGAAGNVALADLGIWAGANGLVRYFQAVPELESLGKMPLHDGRAEAVAGMAQRALEALAAIKRLRSVRKALGPQAGQACNEMWQTHALLGQIVRDPGRVAAGRVGLSPFGETLRLAALTF